MMQPELHTGPKGSQLLYPLIDAAIDNKHIYLSKESIKMWRIVMTHEDM